MDTQAQLIQPLKCEGSNMAQQYKKWRQVFDNFMIAMKYDKEEDKRKIALLLHFIGEQCLDIYNSFPEENKTKYDKVLEAFDGYFIPKKNLAISRHKFFTQCQGTDTLDMFLTNLKKLALDCEFAELKDSLIRDIFICNMDKRHSNIRQRLLAENDIELDKVVTMYRSMEVSDHNNSYLLNETQEVLAVKTHKQTSNFKDRRQTECYRCGNVHYSKWVKCPAQAARCSKCNRIGHFAIVCRTPINNIVTEAGNSHLDENLFIGNFQIADSNMSMCAVRTDDWLIDVTINNNNVSFLIDTGAKANCISYELFCQLKLSKDLLESNSANLVAYNGNKIPTKGSCTLKCIINGNQYVIKFMVVDIACQSVLGAKTCTEIGIVKRVFSNGLLDVGSETSELSLLLKEHDVVFQGLGCLPHKCHLTVRPEVHPKIDAQRKVPFALQDRLKEELDRMTRLGVIEPVSKPTDWVSSVVIVEKSNKKLRICLDPKNLNEAIQRSHFPLPTIEDVRYKLNQAKVFSHLDAYSGFWMIPLDSTSSDLCTFNTPYGRYKYLRLPYGLTCSTEIFSKILIESFSDIPNVILYVDDILIYAPDIKTHNETLEKVLKRAESINLKFNKEKCIFAQKEIKFLGQVFSEQGMCPDYDKIRAIQEMPTPDCQKSLQRFLGVINYLGSYIKNLSSETEILRNLLKKDALWMWDANHDKAFKKLKELITKAPVLCHYDNTKPLTLSVDSSCKALGAVLLQDNKPIAYASKTLTNCQKRYAQIEKELFAILFGCQKFHQYVYGKKIKVETDHQPLVSLFNKPLSQVPNRLQRMMLSLQLYDLNVTHVPGAKMYISDTLSRAALPESEEHSIDNDLAIHANMFKNSLAVSENKLQQIKQETLKDLTLQTLIDYYFNGWPQHKGNAHESVRCYWDYRSEIHVIDDLVFKNTSLVIPESMRREMLQKIHSSHSGLNRSKKLARGVLFWPNMNKDIEQIVEKCMVCLKYKPANPSQPLIISESPLYPWEKVGADILQFKDKKYLVFVDYYSKYIELAYLNTGSSAKHVIMHSKSVFARHGSPLILITDNGPPFDSKEFTNFCVEWDIEHKTSSPHFPQSNGQAEAAVKIIKRILEKAYEENKDPYLALLHYRCNEKEYMKSPAELLMSRKLRSNLPMSKDLLKPKISFSEKEHNRMKIHKQNYKKYYDKHTRDLPELQKNDSIMYKKKPDSYWEPGTIKEVLQQSPRSYIVKSKEGVIYRRNRKHLLKYFNDKMEHNSQFDDKGSYDRSNKINEHSVTMSVPITHMWAKLIVPKPSDNSVETDLDQSTESTSLNTNVTHNRFEVLSSLSDTESVGSYHSLPQQSDDSCVINQEQESIDIVSSSSSNYLVICQDSSDDDYLENPENNQGEHEPRPCVTRSGRRVKKPKKYYD